MPVPGPASRRDVVQVRTRMSIWPQLGVRKVHMARYEPRSGWSYFRLVRPRSASSAVARDSSDNGKVGIRIRIGAVRRRQSKLVSGATLPT